LINDFLLIWLLQARINIIILLRGFNCGGDNLTQQLFATIICYNYLLQIFDFYEVIKNYI